MLILRKKKIEREKLDSQFCVTAQLHSLVQGSEMSLSRKTPCVPDPQGSLRFHYNIPTMHCNITATPCAPPP